MAYNLADISFVDILPSSISGDAKIKAAASALDAQLAEMNAAVGSIGEIMDVSLVDMDIVKHLTWATHVDFWDENYTDSQKRAIVRLSLRLHKRRGTPDAVEQILEDILGGGVVQEWDAYDGRPFHFKVISNAGADDEETDRQLRAAIAWAKNRRSILDAIIKAQSLSAGQNIGGIVSIGVVNHIYQEV
jgi:phage tail P2-like protein